MRFIMLLTLAALLVGCSGSGQPATTAAGPEQTKISMRLQWFAQYQFAGYIVAKEKGYYTEAGLDVTINPGGPDLVSLPLVTTGTDTFGSTGADTILMSREEGIDVVSLATWFQASPVVFMVHSDSGITTPQDFPGHTIGMFYGDNVETEYRALVAATGLDREAVTEIPGDYSIAPFLERRADIWPVYATDQPDLARQAGADVNLIAARDYGVSLMGDVLFTTAEFARENPRTVEAFVQATLRGWEFAIQNQEETLDLILAYNPELDRAHLAFEAAETNRLLQYGPGERCLGFNSPSLWEAEAQLLQELTLLKQAPDLTAAIQNQALEQYYAEKGVSCE